MMSKLINSIAFLALVFFAAGNLSAAPSDLDQSFGTHGKVLTVFDNNSTTYGPRSSIKAIAIQPDGKIVAAGEAHSTTNSVDVAPWFALARYNTNGSLDSTFGSGGKVITRFNGYEEAFAVAIQPDGKIVAAGFTDLGGNNFAFAVARYNSNGSLDTSFDADGRVVTELTGGMDDAAGVIIQADGKIVVSGMANAGVSTVYATVRYNPNGSLDTSFGGTGKVLTDIPGGIEGGAELAQQASGRIVVAGSIFDSVSGQGDFSLVGYNTDGTLDQSFGVGGFVRTDFSGRSDNASDMTVQPDGKIIVVGSSGQSGAYDYAAARYNADGSLDTSFDGDGKFTNDFQGTGTIDAANGVAVQQNGKIVIMGYVKPRPGDNSSFDVGVLRLNPNGGIDASFGSSGKVLTDFNELHPTAFNETQDVFADVLIQPDGKIVVGGDIQSLTADQNHYFGLARYIGDATASSRRTASDFDGDGKADVSVFRPSNGTWYLQESQNGFASTQFGASSDRLVAADYDGDGKTDLAVYRGGTWYLQRSQSGFTGIAFGDSNDIPAPADFDGDGKADLAVFRPSNGTWYLQRSQSGFTGIAFGQNGDKPVAADYDGDGKADIAVYRAGTWYLQRSTLGFTGISFGDSNDRLVPADYDGDGKADIAVFRPSNGTWYLQRSAAGFTSVQFGVGTDLPTAADYDGDGKADIAVFRDGTWYLNRSTAGVTGVAFGASTDRPVPNAFVQ